MAINQHFSKSICRRLRNKGMFVDVEPDTEISNMGNEFCWCTHTMNCLGPDGKVAEIESCQPDRNCFEPL